MLYYIIRPFTYLGLLAFCKKIYLSNSTNIPKDRPVILACNHPSAFLEPCILASFVKHPLHFVVRGDFFRHPFYRKLLYGLHLVPIYRSTNANFQELKQNVALMENIERKLNENVTMMILVEGSANIRKGLRPIQKGIARLAFDTYEKYGRNDLVIIPAGANFDYPTCFRLTSMIGFGHPIPIENYLDTYHENKNKAIRQLIADVQAGMRRNIIHVEKEEDDNLVEQQLLLYRNNQKIKRFPIVQQSPQRLQAEVNIAERINAMKENEKAQLRAQSAAYFQLLKLKNIKDFVVGQTVVWWQLPFLLLGFPIFLIGVLFNFLPPFLGNLIAKKRVAKIQYYIPVAWGSSNILHIFYMIILLIATLILLDIRWLLLFLMIPFLGYFSILYYEIFQEWKAIRKWHQLSNTEQKYVLEIRKKAVMQRNASN